MNRIELIGMLGPHQQDRVIMGGGICMTVAAGETSGRYNTIMLIDNHMKSKLNRYVRYIYRKMMAKYGIEKTREQALRLFTLTTKERDNERPSNEFINALLDLCIEWEITPKIGINPGESLYADLTPIRVRIRKLSERECFRLMNVRDDDIDKIVNSGISRSACYKLAGNSIVCACLMGIFTQLFRADSDSLF